MKVGFIGVGVMGSAMLLNLKKKGFEVSYYARNYEKTKDKLQGVKYYPSIKDLTIANDVIITIVGYPSDVEEVYYKKGNIIDNLGKGKIVIDMTTSSPKLAKRIYQDVKKKGGFSLDAPVTGGDKGAIEGTLVIFVGGDKKAYEKCLPVFKGMGTTILYTGEAGSGQHSKLANQISIAGAISGMAETISYAKKAGLEVAPLIEVWSKGSAGSWQMQNLGPKALVNDFRPGFYIKHFIKDMNLAIDEAKENNLDLKMLTTVRDMFEELSKLGYDECGTQALIDYYNRKS
jgi:3-hydroxyisobutyrate dehydrogenase/2-hydroxy-3-oxopropionate reductase